MASPLPKWIKTSRKMPPTIKAISEINYIIENFWNSPIVTTATGDPDAVNVWVTTLRNLANAHSSRVIGIQLDGVCRITFRRCYERTKDAKPALLQLCFKDMCLIYKLGNTPPHLIPESLCGLLADNTFQFVGVDVHRNAGKVLNVTGVQIPRKGNLLEQAAQRFGRIDLLKTPDLKTLARVVLGKKAERVPVKTMRSQWDAQKLDDDQVLYASLDTFVMKEIGEALAAN